MWLDLIRPRMMNAFFEHTNGISVAVQIVKLNRTSLNRPTRLFLFVCRE